MISKREGLSVIGGIVLAGMAGVSFVAASEYSKNADKLEQTIKDKRESIARGLGVEVPALQTATLALKLSTVGSPNLPFLDKNIPSPNAVAQACANESSDRLKREACGIATYAVGVVPAYREAI